MKKEQFKDCPLNPDYKVGNKGTLLNPNGLSLKKIVYWNESILPRIQFAIQVNGRQKFVDAHKLMADVWLEKPDIQDASLSVIVKDCDLLNIAASNLKWVTRSEKRKFSNKMRLTIKRPADELVPPSEKNQFGGAF